MHGIDLEVLAAAAARIVPIADSDRRPAIIEYMNWLIAHGGLAAREADLTPTVTLLNKLSSSVYGSAFTACAPERQDDILTRLQDIPHPSVQRSFVTIVRLGIGAVFASEGHKGQGETIGWPLVGWRGPRGAGNGAPDV